MVLQQDTSMCQTVAGTGTQGVDCEYLNICAIGYSCILNNDPTHPTGLECAFTCDASRSGGLSCADGPGATYRCFQINRFYSDLPDLPDDYGMCVDPEEWSVFDEDGDGIWDYEDLCPDTPPDTPVDSDGCP